MAVYKKQERQRFIISPEIFRRAELGWDTARLQAGWGSNILVRLLPLVAIRFAVTIEPIKEDSVPKYAVLR